MARALNARLLAVLFLLACGGPPPPTATTAPPTEDTPATSGWVALTPPGSRLTVTAPPAERVPHTLRYHAGALELAFADAQVEPGAEREVAEAYLTHLAERSGGELEHRVFSVDGASGLDVVVPGAPRLRAILVWREGAVARLEIGHAPEDAIDVARVVDSISFDPSRPLDPRAALDLDADAVEDLPLLRVTTEQLVFREGGAPSPFVGPGVAVDVAWATDDEGPPDERERGRRLGARFQGLPLEDTQVAQLEGEEGLPGFALHAFATIEGHERAMLGAYLEADGGALLVRASVDRDQEAAWAPRLWALIRSLRLR